MLEVIIYNPASELDELEYEEGITSIWIILFSNYVHLHAWILSFGWSWTGWLFKGMQKCQPESLLEAKIGSYRIFDAEIITLISESGWVADHVSNGY